MKLPTIHELWTSKTSNVLFVELLVPADHKPRRFAVCIVSADGEGVWEVDCESAARS